MHAVHGSSANSASLSPPLSPSSCTPTLRRQSVGVGAGLEGRPGFDLLISALLHLTQPLSFMQINAQLRHQYTNESMTSSDDC